jgi:predicted MFS family arabinose efflux permease
VVATQTQPAAGAATGPAVGLDNRLLVVLAWGIFTAVGSNSMTSVMLPDVRRDFGVSPDALAWVVAGFIIPFAAGGMLYGRLADMRGIRALYLGGLGLSAAGSILSAVAPSFWLLVAARAIQGAGAASIPSLSFAAIYRLANPYRRGPAVGALMIATGIGFAVGPVLGAVLVDAMSWRGPLVFTGLCALTGLAAGLRFVPAIAGTPGQRLDGLAAALIVAGITALVLAVNRLPVDRADTLGLAGLALVLPLGAALWLRNSRSQQPFIHGDIVRDSTFWRFAVIGAGMQAAHFGAIVMLPLMLVDLRDLAIVEVGLLLAPGALAMAVAGRVGGALVQRAGALPLTRIGVCLELAGAALLATVATDWPAWAVALVYVSIAVGFGIVNASVYTAGTARLRMELSGVGSALFNLVFMLGGAIAVAILGGVLRARAGASEALIPFAPGGDAAAYSDAALVLLAGGVVAFVLAALPLRTR